MVMYLKITLEHGNNGVMELATSINFYCLSSYNVYAFHGVLLQRFLGVL